jgi:hypothetical protein
MLRVTALGLTLFVCLRQCAGFTGLCFRFFSSLGVRAFEFAQFSYYLFAQSASGFEAQVAGV